MPKTAVSTMPATASPAERPRPEAARRSRCRPAGRAARRRARRTRARPGARSRGRRARARSGHARPPGEIGHRGVGCHTPARCSRAIGRRDPPPRWGLQPDLRRRRRFASPTRPRRLGAAARAAGLVVPAFRCPPRVAGVVRTIRRYPGGAVVSVRLRDRPCGRGATTWSRACSSPTMSQGEAALRVRTRCSSPRHAGSCRHRRIPLPGRVSVAGA